MTPETRLPSDWPAQKDPLIDPVYQRVRTLIGFVQGLFNALPDGRYRWSPDPERTEITVTGAYPLQAAAVNARPAIVIMAGQTSYANIGIGNFDGISDHGNMIYRDVIASTAIINCLARTGPEASSLAWFVASNIKALRRFLQMQGGFLRIGQDMTIGTESPPGGLLQDFIDGGVVNVQVMTAMYIPHTWEVRYPTDAHLATQVELQSISGDTLQELQEQTVAPPGNGT